MREFSRAHCISFGVEPCHIFSSEYYYYYYHFRRLLYILHYFSLHFPSFTATMITTNYLRSLLCCWSFCFLSLLEYRSNVNYVLNSSIQKRPTKKKNSILNRLNILKIMKIQLISHSWDMIILLYSKIYFTCF